MPAAAAEIEQLSERLQSLVLLRDDAGGDKMARRRTLEAFLKVVQTIPVPKTAGGDTKNGNAMLNPAEGSVQPFVESALRTDADQPGVCTEQGESSPHCSDLVVLQASASGSLTDVLQCLSDPSERCRELSAQLTSAWLARLADRLTVCPLLIPVMRQRLAPYGETSPREPSEEVRLCLAQLVLQLVTSDGASLAAYLDDLVAILAASVADPAPDVKTTACSAICVLAPALPRHFHLQSASLVPPLVKAVSHQRWRVREPCIRALGDVVQYGDNALLRDVISHLAQRMFDQVPQVRLAVTEVMGRWLCELRDRYSFFAKILPLLLTSLSDPVDNVRETAERLWLAAGELYLKENEEEHRQLINYPAPTPDGYPPNEARPTLGCRLLSQRCFCSLLPGACGDLADWVPATRVKVSRLLHVLVLHQEAGVTQYLAKLAAAITAAFGDDERDVIHWITRTTELLGCFCPVSALSEIVVRAVSADCSAAARQLLVLAGCLRGSPQRAELTEQVAKVVSATDLCFTHESQRQVALLAVISALLPAPQPPAPPAPAVPPLFKTLLAVVGHSGTNDDTRQSATDTIHRLAAAAGTTVHALLAELGPALLQELSEDVEVWAASSSELLVLSALLTVDERPPAVLLAQTVPVLAACCRPGRPAPLRLSAFSLVARLLSSDDVTALRPLLHSVTDDIIQPSLVWSPGRSDAAIRTAAISCLLLELKLPELLMDTVTTDAQNLIKSVTGVLEESDKKPRLLGVRCVAALCRLCPPARLPAEFLHHTMLEVMRRLDDTGPEVRHAAASAVPAMVGALPAQYCGAQWSSHVQHFAKTLLVFMDDTDEILQQIVYEALVSLGSLNAAVVCAEATEQRDRHRSSRLCDELVAQLDKQLQKQPADNGQQVTQHQQLDERSGDESGELIECKETQGKEPFGDGEQLVEEIRPE